jgi:hypothetical protein
VGAGLRVAGPVSLLLLGLTGFLRLANLRMMDDFFTIGFLTDRWKLALPLWLMFISWFVLVITGTLSAVWYEKILAKKLPYTAGLRDLEERRAAQPTPQRPNRRSRALDQAPSSPASTPTQRKGSSVASSWRDRGGNPSSARRPP